MVICASLSAQALTRPACHRSLPATANLRACLWQLRRGSPPHSRGPRAQASPSSSSSPNPGPGQPRGRSSYPSRPSCLPLPLAQPIRPLTPGAADKLFLSLALCLSLGARTGGGAGGEGEEMGSFMLSKAKYINYKTAICRVKVC